MNARNLLPPSIGLLGLLGILGMLASMLACRPSWSPDGSKILFPYYDPETHDVGVALYDRATGKARSLFARQSARWDDRVVIGQWERGGERAVLFSGERELLTLPVDSPRPARRIEVPSGVLCGAGPWPVVKDHLFCCGARVFRIGLLDGTVISRGYEGVDKTMLLGDGQTILYLRFMDKEPDFIGYELGRLDAESLDTNRLLRISMEALEAHGIQELEGSIAFEPEGDRLAMTATTERGPVVVVLGMDGIESIVVPALPVEAYKLGNVEWARDSERLFAAASSYGPEHGTTELSLAEISLADGESKLYPIVQIRKAYAFFEPFEIQIALSPDGATIAVATTYLDDGEVATEDRGLYLLALDEPEKAVTKVPWPPSSVSSRPRFDKRTGSPFFETVIS